MNLYMPALKYMLDKEIKQPDNRRAFFKETPPWFLFFRNRYYDKASDFVYQTLCAMSALETNPLGISKFHSETGIVTQHLIRYLQSIEDADQIMYFIANMRSYLLGDKKRMPRNISKDKFYYEKLRGVIKNDYTNRLITEYKLGNQALNTQDFVVLFKMPIFALFEAVLCLFNEDDIINAIDQYRG